MRLCVCVCVCVSVFVFVCVCHWSVSVSVYVYESVCVCVLTFANTCFAVNKNNDIDIKAQDTCFIVDGRIQIPLVRGVCVCVCECVCLCLCLHVRECVCAVETVCESECLCRGCGCAYLNDSSFVEVCAVVLTLCLSSRTLSLLGRP